MATGIISFLHKAIASSDGIIFPVPVSVKAISLDGKPAFVTWIKEF